MQKSSETKLDKLLAKKQALEAQIRQAEARERLKERKLDTRRKVLAGAAVLDEAERRPEYREALMALLGRFLSRADERALFGLPSIGASGPELATTTPEVPQEAIAESATTRAA